MSNGTDAEKEYLKQMIVTISGIAGPIVQSVILLILNSGNLTEKTKEELIADVTAAQASVKKFDL